MSFCNRELKTYAASQARFKDGSITFFKPIIAFYKSWTVSNITNNIVSKKYSLKFYLCQLMKWKIDLLENTSKKTTQNRTVKAIKTISKAAEKKYIYRKASNIKLINDEN